MLIKQLKTFFVGNCGEIRFFLVILQAKLRSEMLDVRR